MKRFGLSKVLGLAIGPTSMHLAEVAIHGEKYAIERVAEFVYPAGISPENPAGLGQALRQFLRTNNFTTRDTVIGLPAKWLVTRRKEVPPASPEMAAGTLRLQAEGEFDDLVMDFCGQTSRSQATAVLLIATGQKHIDGCVSMAAAAGLRLRAISATAAALGRVTQRLTGESGLVLSLSGGGAELIVNLDQAPEQLRHVPVNDPGVENMGMLVGEIRRTLASLSRNGTPLTLALWDDAPDSATGKLLADRLGMPVTSPSFKTMAPSARGATDGYGPPVALALSALDPAGLPVDFLHSRLAPPKVRTNKRPILIGIAAGAALVLAVVGGVVDLNLKQAQFDKLHADSAAQAKEVATAQTAANRLAEARRWTTRKPRYVACLRDLTALFPEEGTIWATNMSLGANDKGTLTGKAGGEPQVRALKDRMLASKQFTEVTPDIHEGSRSAAGVPETTFTINFTYRVPE